MLYRDTLFISHATPQDNEFSIWLASRLEMMGYKVWLDKEGLLGGERFWQTIQKAIDSSAKVLLIYSNNIITEDGSLKQGIENEIEYAKSIASSNNLKDYIIPLHIDNSPYNLAIGFPNINHIPFEKNWADGLKALKKKLDKDDVPKTFNISDSVMSEWYENNYVSNCSIVDSPELFYSSWWTVADLPEKFYLYQFSNLEQAKNIRAINQDIPLSMISNVISSFEENINHIITKDGEEIVINPLSKHTFSITQILNGFESETFPQHREVENHFKRLLFNIITNFVYQRGFRKYVMSNKKIAYYLPKYENLKKIEFKFPFSNKKKLKSILGKFESSSWHYALSFQPTLFPFVGFSLKSHIIFTTDGFKVIDDDKKQHSFRRKKGKRFFNEEWRDLQLAFIQSLKKNDEINIPITNSNKTLKMKEWPEFFWSEVGYLDPSSQMDLDKVEDYSEQIEDTLDD